MTTQTVVKLGEVEFDMDFVLLTINKYLNFKVSKAEFTKLVNFVPEVEFYDCPREFAKHAFKKSRGFKLYFYEELEKLKLKQTK